MREKKTPSRSEKKERERKAEACRRVLAVLAAVRTK